MSELQFIIKKANEKDLPHIRELQLQYHFKNVSDVDKSKHGFVSVETEIPLLFEIKKDIGISVAKVNSKIVGYEMPIGLNHATKIPLLDPFVNRFLNLKYKGKKIKDYRVVIAGQILVDKKYKGKGIAESLHKDFVVLLKGRYDLIISEVSRQNPRSLNVSTKKLGFSIIDKYEANGRSWYIILQDIRK